jgi:hypothetical protein
MIKNFQRYVNPLSARLRKQLSNLEAHQTSRTAMEVYNTIIETFMQQGIALRRPIILPRLSYSLTFRENYETLTFVCDGLFHGTATTASFGIIDKDDQNKIQQSYVVSTLPARKIAGLKQDIDLRRIKSTERMPVSVRIGDTRYPITYRNAIVNPFEVGVS